jgi:hypothetical protein
MENIDMSLLNKKLLWITLINGGYIHYTKNFLKSMEAAKVTFTLIIFCLDDHAFAELKDNPFCICIMVNFLSINLPTDMKKWGDIDYKKIVFAKLDAIAYTLKSTYNLGVKAVGYIDTDILLFSDPTPIILNELQLYPDTPIVCQCDEQLIECSDRNKCGYICSGVIVIRNIKEYYHLFNYEQSDMYEFHADQDFLLKKLTTLSIKYRTIEKYSMRNGGYYNAKYGKDSLFKHTLPLDPLVCLIHFNYISGDDKEASMRKQGLWLLDSSSNTVSIAGEYYTHYC